MFLFNWWARKKVVPLVVRGDVEIDIVFGFDGDRLVPVSPTEIEKVLATAEAKALSALVAWNRNYRGGWCFEFQLKKKVLPFTVVVTVVLSTTNGRGLNRRDAFNLLEASSGVTIDALEHPGAPQGLVGRLVFSDSSQEEVRIHPRRIARPEVFQ